MRLRYRIGDAAADIRVGRTSILHVERELSELSREAGIASDVATSVPALFADAAKWNARPIVVLLHGAAGPYGAVLCHARTAWGLPLGVITAGHKCGRGGVIAARPDVADLPGVAAAGAQALLRRFVAHTVMVRVPAGLEAALPRDFGSGTVAGRWRQRDASSRLPLGSSVDGLMSGLSYKMRRNLRYYRRRADEALGCALLPALSWAQTREAVAALSPGNAFAPPPARSLAYAAALAGVEGGFLAGLRDGRGRWLSLLTGYRQGGESYITSQLNSAEQKSASMAAVMRSHFIEHEISRGATDIIFVGGSSSAWNRSCVPQACHELLAIRRGVQSVAIRGLRSLLPPRGLMSEVYGAVGAAAR